MKEEYRVTRRRFLTTVAAVGPARGSTRSTEACFGDMFERAMFNAAQGARFANGKALTYYSADERLSVRQHPPEGPSNPRFIFTAARYPDCCHNSGARANPYAVSAMLRRSRDQGGDGLAATLYGPDRVTAKIDNGTDSNRT